MAGNGWKLLEIAGKGRSGSTWLEMAENDQKWLKIVLDGWKLLKMIENG